MGGYINSEHLYIRNINSGITLAMGKNYYGKCSPKIYRDDIINGSFYGNSRIIFLPKARISDLSVTRGTVQGAFDGCNNLAYIESISNPDGETLEATSCALAFYCCFPLIGIGDFNVNTHNCTNFSDMFRHCYELRKCPILDCSSGTTFRNMFSCCYKLKTIEKLIFSSTNISLLRDVFSSCKNLSNVTVEGTIKVDSSMYLLNNCLNLTVDSLMSFINAFEDNTGEETQYTVTIGATNLAKLSAEQIAVATNKNILLA